MTKYNEAKERFNALIADRRALVNGALPVGQNRFSQVAIANEAMRISRGLHDEELKSMLREDTGMEQDRKDEAYIADSLLEWIDTHGTAQGFNQAYALEARDYMLREKEDD